MLSKCANPSCTAAFNYLSEGRLFEFELDASKNYCVEPRRVKKPSGIRELFWLCAECSSKMTLQCEGGSVNVAPVAKRGRAA